MAGYMQNFYFIFPTLTILVLIFPCLILSQMYEDVCTDQMNEIDHFYAQRSNYSIIKNKLRYIQTEEDYGLTGRTPLAWGQYDNSSDGYISFRISLSPAVYNYVDDDTSASTDGDNSVDSAETEDYPIPKRISERKCIEYIKQTRQMARETFLKTADLSLKSFILQPCVQKSLSSLIGGGTEALKDEFPHMAAIGWRTDEGGYSFSCGGTLISTNFVLTAGHCTYDPKMKSNPIPAVVFIGNNHIDYNYHRSHNSSSFLVPIKSIRKHPFYRPPQHYNDIALIELVREIPFSLEIRPACLWNRDDFGLFTTAIGTGWGYTENGNKPEKLQKVTLSLFDNKFCKNDLRRYVNRKWKQGFIQTQMCAWDLSKKKDTCQGDSGGPLALTDDSCIYYVVGVTSFSVRNDKCLMKKPSVYTRVASYLDWIESVVWNE